MANHADLTSQGTEKYSSAALENAAQITTTQSMLFGFDGRNTDTSNAIFVMAFDSATAPSNGTIPVACVGVPPASTGANNAQGNFGYTPPSYAIKFKNGIYVAASSTDASGYTAIATNKTLIHVQYATEDGVHAV